MLSLFDDDEFARRYREAMVAIAAEPRMEYRVVVESGHTGLPRASGIGGCARQQYYALSDTPITDPPNPVYNWAQNMGYAGQEIAGAILQRMGYTLEVPTETLGSDVISGHPDGILSGLDLPGRTLWDNKVRGYFAFGKLVNQGLPLGDPTMYLQMQVYMKYLGLSQAIITVTPHDVAATRRYSGAKLSEYVVHRLLVEYDESAADLAEDRARALVAAKNLGMMVAREHDPVSGKFPCAWQGGSCPWVTRCLADDLEAMEGFFPIPELPDSWREVA